MIANNSPSLPWNNTFNEFIIYLILEAAEYLSCECGVGRQMLVWQYKYYPSVMEVSQYFIHCYKSQTN